MHMIVNGSTEFLFLFMKSLELSERRQTKYKQEHRNSEKALVTYLSMQNFPVNGVWMAIIQYFNYPGTSLLNSLLTTDIKEQILCESEG